MSGGPAIDRPARHRRFACGATRTAGGARSVDDFRSMPATLDAECRARSHTVHARAAPRTRHERTRRITRRVRAWLPRRPPSQTRSSPTGRGLRRFLRADMAVLGWPLRRRLTCRGWRRMRELRAGVFGRRRTRIPRNQRIEIPRGFARRMSAHQPAVVPPPARVERAPFEASTASRAPRPPRRAGPLRHDHVHVPLRGGR